MGMKVNGKSMKGPRIHTLVLPYGNNDEDFLVFKFRALTAKDDFEKVMKRPQPPKITKPGGETFFDLNDKNFQAAIEDWGNKKVNWEFLQSISVTDGLEWETVNMSEPSTWANWRQDIENNFGTVDAGRIFNGFLDANSLSEEKLEEARQRFLASQEVAQSEN